jgi:hypothetical protein
MAIEKLQGPRVTQTIKLLRQEVVAVELLVNIKIMKQKKYFLLAIILLISSISFGQKKGYTVNEEKAMNLFSDFKNYLISSINNKIDLSDSAHLQYLLNHFFFINTKSDSLDNNQINLSEISSEKMNHLKKSIGTFYNYFLSNKNEKLAENLTALPIRISKDTFIFKRFNAFQKANTLVFFDKRHPDKTLGYMLFIPPVKNVNPRIKIWSWILSFKFGKFYFTSLTGDEGYEYMFN